MKNRKSGKIVAAFITGILCLGLAACSGSSSSTSAGSSSQTEAVSSSESSDGAGGSAGTVSENSGSDAASSETIKIGVLKIADSFPVYAAQAEGLFEKNGINVEIVEFQSASDQSVAYEAGELDGMMTDMIVQSLVNKSAGDEGGMKAVAMAFGGTKEEGRFLVVSSPDSDIKEPSDLEGCKIGISENTMMEYLVTSYLTDLGVDLSKVEFVNIPKLTLRLDSVMEGSDVQAAILPDPLAIEAVSRGCNTVIDDTQLEKNYSQSVFTLSNDIIGNRPDDAAAYVDAINEAIEMIDADPDSFSELFIEKANVADAVKDIYTVPSYTADCLPTEDEVASLEDWMVSKGLLDSPYSYDDMVREQ